MSDLININEAAKAMGYKTRTFIAWCKEHHINIFSEEGKRKKYIVMQEFIVARNLNLKNEAGINLGQYLQSAMNIFSEFSAAKESISKKYKSGLGKHGEEFLADLQDNSK